MDHLPVGCVYNSLLLDTIRKTLICLNRRDALQELHNQAKVHRRWGMAMTEGYKMQPTRAERKAFVEHIRWYYLLKSFHMGPVIWYDWQMYYAFPFL